MKLGTLTIKDFLSKKTIKLELHRNDEGDYVLKYMEPIQASLKWNPDHNVVVDERSGKIYKIPFDRLEALRSFERKGQWLNLILWMEVGDEE